MKVLFPLAARLKSIFLVVMLALGSLNACAQEAPIIDGDTVIIEREDTVLMKSYAARFDPRKALFYAAVMPGLGQVYNKKYWKVPLVYGGFVILGMNINTFNKAYKYYRSHLFYNLSHDLEQDSDVNPTTRFQTSTLRRFTDNSRRDRDFWVIMMGLMYVLQIVDAHVDAHLKEFDLNPNLKMSFQPTIESDAILGRQQGMSVIVKF
jgi:hypothetical protein